MRFLVERLGRDRLRNIEVLTPSDKHFPESYSGSEEEVGQVFGRVCNQMGVSPESVDLVVFDGARPLPDVYDGCDTPKSLYEQHSTELQSHKVWIERTQTQDLLRLVATAAHELARRVVLRDGLLTDSDADFDFVSDLLPVVRGLGVFAANTTLLERSVHIMAGTWRSVSKAGYLPSRMFGYALAVFAWLREESRPVWARYLHADPRSALKSGLRYLRKTNDCLCRSPAGLGCDIPHTLHARLTSDIAGVCLDALWELRRPDPPKLSDDDWRAIVARLDHSDRILMSETALAIAALHRPDSNVVGRCLKMLEKYDSNHDIQSACALVLSTQKEAIARQSNEMESVIAELLKLLNNESQRVVMSSLVALKRLRPTLDFFGIRQLMEVLRVGLVKCDDLLVMHVVSALHATCESPKDEAKKFFDQNGELKSRAYTALTAKIEEASLITARLPTRASLPIPLMDCQPAPVRLRDISVDAISYSPYLG